MKILFAIMLISGLGPAGHAQILSDSSLFVKGMEMIDAAGSEEQFIRTAEYFRTMAEQHDTPWLARYYAGLSFVLASQKNDKGQVKDSLIDNAQREVDKALEINPDEPEILILQAFVFQTRIEVNPITRGLNYSMKANAMLQKAIEISPDNPRAQLLLAYNIYYTPALFGGGPDKALPLFIKARDEFESYRMGFAFAPHWGRQEAIDMVETCRSEVKQ